MGLVPQDLSTLPKDPDHPGRLRGQFLDWGLAAVHALSPEEIKQIICKEKGLPRDVPSDDCLQNSDDQTDDQTFDEEGEVGIDAETAEGSHIDNDPSDMMDDSLPSIQLPTLDQCKNLPIPTVGLAHPYQHSPEDVPQLLRFQHNLDRTLRSAEITVSCK
jgi:hypothetical protein